MKDRLNHDECYAIDAGKIAKEPGWLSERIRESGIQNPLSDIWETLNGVNMF